MPGRSVPSGPKAWSGPIPLTFPFPLITLCTSFLEFHSVSHSSRVHFPLHFRSNWISWLPSFLSVSLEIRPVTNKVPICEGFAPQFKYELKTFGFIIFTHHKGKPGSHEPWFETHCFLSFYCFIKHKGEHWLSLWIETNLFHRQEWGFFFFFKVHPICFLVNLFTSSFWYYIPTLCL